MLTADAGWFDDTSSRFFDVYEFYKAVHVSLQMSLRYNQMEIFIMEFFMNNFTPQGIYL